MNFIILAGGSGTRLFPVSRENYPKQFMKIGNSDSSLLQQTVKRALDYSLYKNSKDTIWIVSSEKYRFFIQSQLDELLKTCKTSCKINIVLEPVGKNTAPAISLAVRKAFDEGIDEDEVFSVLPSDHIIFPQQKFNETLEIAEKCAKDGYIVTFGIKPTKPETGYGYIEVDKNMGNCFRVSAFTEKPSKEKAQEYIEKGNFFWNSGMFAFTGKIIKEEIAEHCSDIAKLFDCGEANLLECFINEVPSISIDYALMEKTSKAVLVPALFNWSDVGSWESIYEVLDKESDRNVLIGKTITIDSKNNLIFGDKRLIATIGVEEMVVVETPDAILIARKGECQKVKDVVETLKKNNDPLIKEHITNYRPWGSYTLLEVGDRYKIKRITVNPGESLSLQMHYHRSEHWVVVKGTAKVIKGNEEIFVHENESVYIPKSTIHRLENPGKIPLEIIEVQVGEYVEEDDIVRFQDRYKREEKKGFIQYL